MSEEKHNINLNLQQLYIALKFLLKTYLLGRLRQKSRCGWGLFWRSLLRLSQNKVFKGIKCGLLIELLPRMCEGYYFILRFSMYGNIWNTFVIGNKITSCLVYRSIAHFIILLWAPGLFSVLTGPGGAAPKATATVRLLSVLSHLGDVFPGASRSQTMLQLHPLGDYGHLNAFF